MVEPTHLKNMRKSNWIIISRDAGENLKNELPPPSHFISYFTIKSTTTLPLLLFSQLLNSLLSAAFVENTFLGDLWGTYSIGFFEKVGMVKYHIMQNVSKPSHAGILRAITLKRAPSSGEKMAFDWSLRVCFRLLKGRKEIVNSMQNGNNIR